jgi:hypothetical protein
MRNIDNKREMTHNLVQLRETLLRRENKMKRKREAGGELKLHLGLIRKL